MKYSPRVAVAELVLAGMLWGFGFIACIWALRETGPFALSVARFGSGAALMVPLILLRKEWRRDLSLAQAKLALMPGLFLAMMLVFQTWGLRYTTATKSSFITALYVLLVPILERFWLRRALHPLHWVFVATALLGTALICELYVEDWNRGDLLTMLCTIACSFQILWFGMISPRIGSAMTFNFWQTAWAFVFSLPVLLFESNLSVPQSSLAWFGIGMLVIGSTLIAFALQIRAQRVLSPSTASLLFLLESPFATMYAMVLLGEILSPTQWLGGATILISVAGATWLSSRPAATAQYNK